MLSSVVFYQANGNAPQTALTLGLPAQANTTTRLQAQGIRTRLDQRSFLGGAPNDGESTGLGRLRFSDIRVILRDPCSQPVPEQDHAASRVRMGTTQLAQ